MASIEAQVQQVIAANIDARKLTSIEMTILTPTDVLKVENIKSMAIASNFHTAVSDVFTITFILPFGAYVKRLLANKDNLLAHLRIKTPITGPLDSKGVPQIQQIVVTRRLAVYMDNDLDVPNIKDLAKVPEEILNKENPKEITVNCIDLEIVALKRVTPSISMKSAKIESAILYNFSTSITKNGVKVGGRPLLEELTEDEYKQAEEEARKLEEQEAETVEDDGNAMYVKTVQAMSVARKGGDISRLFPPDNDDIYANIFLDRLPGMDVDTTTLPYYLQDVYGVYNGGMCSYYGNHFTFGKDSSGKKQLTVETRFTIKPKFDIRETYPVKAQEGNDDKAKKAKARLDAIKKFVKNEIINLYIPTASNATKGIKNSYRTNMDGSIDIVAKKGDKLYLDGGVAKEQGKTAVVTSTYKGRKIKPFDIEVNGNVITCKETEYKVQGINKMEDPKFAPALENKDMNQYKERAEIFLKSGNVGSIMWNNSSPFIINPAAPLIIHYEYIDPEDEKTKKVGKYYGNILMANSIFVFSDHDSRGNALFHVDTELNLIILGEEEIKSK